MIIVGQKDGSHHNNTYPFFLDRQGRGFGSISVLRASYIVKKSTRHWKASRSGHTQKKSVEGMEFLGFRSERKQSPVLSVPAASLLS